MSIDETRSIAQSLGINTKASDTLQDIAYMIIDEQAIMGSKLAAQKPNKQRATKKKTAASAKTAKTKKDSEDVVCVAQKMPKKTNLQMQSL